MRNEIICKGYVPNISLLLLFVLMIGTFSCTSFSTGSSDKEYYTFTELGELEYLDVLEQQLCDLKPGTAAYCKKLIQYKINKSLQTYILDTTLLDEIETEVNKQTDAPAYAPVVMYLKSCNLYKTDIIAAYESAIKAREIFESQQDIEGIIRINFVIININYSWTNRKYYGEYEAVETLKKQIFELLPLSSYPIHHMNYCALSIIYLRNGYSDAEYVFKVDSIICEAQNFVHQNPKVEYLLPTIYHYADANTYDVDTHHIHNDYALMALQTRIDPNRYITYGNYANKFYRPHNIRDSIIKYTQLSMISNHGKDLLFLASQYKQLAGMYEDLGNYPLAIEYLYTYDSLSQIINENIRQKEILGVETKHKYEKVQIQKEQLIREKRNGIIAIVLITFMLILISSLLVYLKKINARQKAWIKLKDNIISVISHDLKSHMIAIAETSKLIFEAMNRNDLDSVKDVYPSFNNMVSSMYAFTLNLVDWLKDKDGLQDKELVRILIQNLQESTLSYGRFKNVHIKFSESLLDTAKREIYAAKGAEVIIRNLVSNIINHTDATAIEIGGDLKGEYLYISITDDATPMDDDSYDFVMDRLKSGYTDRLFMSQGFGLSLVSRFMKFTFTKVEINRLEVGHLYLLSIKMV